MGSLKSRKKNISFQTLYIVFLKSLLRKKGVWIILLIGIITAVIFQIITSVSQVDRMVSELYSSYTKSKFYSSFNSSLFLEDGNFSHGFFYELFRLSAIKGTLYISGRSDILFISIITTLGMYLTYFSFISKKNKGGFLVLLSTNTNKSQLMWANIFAIITTGAIALTIYSITESILINELYRGSLNGSKIQDEVNKSFGTFFYYVRGEELLKNPLSNFEGEIFKPGISSGDGRVNVANFLFNLNINPFTAEANSKIQEIISSSNENIAEIIKENLGSIFSYTNAVALFFANLGIYLILIIFIIGLFLVLSSFITSISLITVIVLGLITLTSIALPIMSSLDIENKEAIITSFKLVVPLNSLDDFRAALILRLNGGFFTSSNLDAEDAYATLFADSFGNATFKSSSSPETWVDIRILVGVLASSIVFLFGLKHFLNKRLDWK